MKIYGNWIRPNPQVLTPRAQEIFDAGADDRQRECRNPRMSPTLDAIDRIFAASVAWRETVIDQRDEATRERHFQEAMDWAALNQGEAA